MFEDIKAIHTWYCGIMPTLQKIKSNEQYCLLQVKKKGAKTIYIQCRDRKANYYIILFYNKNKLLKHASIAWYSMQ